MNLESIKSNYKIIKYIKTDWVEKLQESSVLPEFTQKNLFLPELNYSVINLLEEKFKTSDLKELDRLTVLQQYHLDELVDCKKIISNIECSVKQDIMSRVYENSFIPLEVIQWIEMKGLECSIIKFLNIDLIVINDQPISNTLLKHIIRIISWMLRIKGDITIPISIYIFLSPNKKNMESQCLNFNLNSHTCHLSRTNINSGISWGGNWILIFRSEEILKVLIHELAHYLVIDVQLYSNIIDSYCYHIKMGSESKKILVNEAYAELIAIYLHTMYVCYFNTDFNNFDSELFWNLYLTEEKFTICQINKIFANYSIESIQYFAKPNNFVQYTNVISYFIIKYLFFINTKFFLLIYESKHQTVKLIKYLLARFFKLKIPQVKLDSNINTSLKMSFYSII
jgi:hypothetical protein